MSESVKNKLATEKKAAKPELNSIFFVGGEKGGVGKSFFARILVNYLIAKGYKDLFNLIEGDPLIGDVSSIFDAESVAFSDSRYTCDGPNVIIDRIEEKSAIVNLPSNVMTRFNSWIERLDVLSLKGEYYKEIVYFFVSDGCWRSVEQFLNQIEKYDNNKFPHCLVLNKGRLTSADNFEYLNTFCPELTSKLKKHKVPVLYMPTLPPIVQFMSDRTNLSYTEMADCNREELSKILSELVDFQEDQDKEQLINSMLGRIKNLAQESMIKRYIKKTETLFDKVFPQGFDGSTGLSKIVKEQEKDLSKSILPTDN